MSGDAVDAHSLRELFVGWFDYYAGRTTERLAGLTDDEYLWEPVANCWSIRPGAGGYVMDNASPPPDPAPVTTIAWRLVHVCSMLSEHGLRAVAFEGGKADHKRPSRVPATAAEVTVEWERSVARWRHDIATVSEARLWVPLGPEAGPFADDPVASFIEHIHDELIHHTAEIGLLRDLYRHRRDGDG
jgi:DinB superfamily